jgi:hypothetical protein
VLETTVGDLSKTTEALTDGVTVQLAEVMHDIVKVIASIFLAASAVEGQYPLHPHPCQTLRHLAAKQELDGRGFAPVTPTQVGHH